jgi:hypothetical protein
MTIYTPVREVKVPTFPSIFKIGILSNNYSDISIELLERIVALDVPTFMSGNVPVKYGQFKNVWAPGRSDDEEYLKNALSCEIIFGLSERDDCLVLVGREFLFYDKKVIVSDTRANREHYGNHVEYISKSDNEHVILDKIKCSLNKKLSTSNYKKEYQQTCQDQIRRYSAFIS